MKAKDKSEKELIKLKYATGLEKALKESQFASFRELSIHISFEPSHIQRISTGKIDVVLTTNVALAEGLGMSLSQFSAYFDNVTEKEMADFAKRMEERKRSSKSSKLKKNKKRKK
jgi:hypothetical protein